MTIGNRNRAWAGGGGGGQAGQIRWLDFPNGAMAKTGLDLDPYSGGYSFDRGRTVRLSAEFALTADANSHGQWNFLLGHESYDDADGWKFRLYGSDWPPYFQGTDNGYYLDSGTRYVLTGYVSPDQYSMRLGFESEGGQGDGCYVTLHEYAATGTTFCIGGADTILNDFSYFYEQRRTWPGVVGRTTLWYNDGDAIADFVPWRLPDGTCGFMDVAGGQGFLSSATEVPFREGSL